MAINFSVKSETKAMNNITEIERRELQEKIESATGQPFPNPQPEFFISGMMGVFLTAEIPQECPPFPPAIKVQISLLKEIPGPLKTLASFGYN
jgi:hypothetical protein